jgi:dihydroflavonol-4-reductase
VSERFMSTRDIYEIACAAVQMRPPTRDVPLWVMSAAAAITAPLARATRRESRLTPLTVRLMHIMSPMDHSKAIRELGWNPTPTQVALAEAARFFVARRSASRTPGQEKSAPAPN